ncbi:uncharacterized protein involved in exopolysaccharide biosynthesis/Mrp family chromosome partitioning ATPase [Kaistia hirudinis]|uniref:Uncharacterized protein involved in exopolysaccharide biosynthesis/Mrp family chromosome partitioning ATPase n=1 Tax=Kaistia hirudinis TaxID=1293440 RepID=A0A840ASL8_9HYPH|nr:GumC family protein [Kaistia hirudinis]MBB3932228.1 uncharacterized protein involved in exopolysaccharide biosynthesis/Mrp family chromosome partitioning ATPase [Kaistia hirudinis]
MVGTLAGALDRRPIPADAPAMAGAPGDAIDLSAVFGILVRRWWVIALVLALFLGAAYAYVATATRIYSATTRVLLDPRDKQIVGSDLTANQGGGPQPGWIETQVDLVTAFSTLKNVVLAENLIDDPEFGGTGRAGDLDSVVRSLAEHVRAERTADTYVVDVIASSVSPEKAAALSRAVASAFVASSTEAKQNAARQANDLLLRQVDDLRNKAREADERVQRYRAEHGLLQVDGKPVDEQTLTQLNQANVEAKLKADQTAERWRTIDSLARSGSPDFGPAMDGVDSPVLGRLKVELAIVQKQQAELSETLGSRHPKMASLEAEIVRTRALVLQELKSLAAKARIDADLARAQADATGAALAAATRQVGDSSQAGVGLKELEGEATIRRDVYRAFVARAQETGLQENLQVPDVRIVTPAQVPLYPVQPRKSVILALALIGGLGTGVSLALYFGRPRARVARTLPPDAPRAAEPEAADAPAHPAVLAVLPMPAPLLSGAELPAGEAAERLADFTEGAGDALDDLAAALTRSDETDGPVVRIVFGTAAPAAIAAVAVGLAETAARDGTETLLVDVNGGSMNAASALIGREARGILDVELADAPATEIGARLDGTSIVLLPAASAELRRAVATHGARIAETVEDVADGFGHIVVDLGSACPPELFSRLADLADDVLMVVDAAEVGRDDIAELFEELASIVPALRGIVAVRAVPVAVASARAIS